MAKTTAVAADPNTRTYVLTVTFTVDVAADEQLQTEQGVHDEARSWLEDLGCDVQAVTLQRE